MGEFRALTVRPPWAHMIAHCGKAPENRSKPVSYRGLIAIHAGAYSRWDRDAEDSPVAVRAWREWAARWTYPGQPVKPLTRDGAFQLMTFGAVIAVAEVTGCHHSDECMFPGWPVPPGGRTGCSPWAARGQWHWELADVHPLPEPVPCKGMLGLWRLPGDVEKAVRAQLGEAGRG